MLDLFLLLCGSLASNRRCWLCDGLLPETCFILLSNGKSYRLITSHTFLGCQSSQTGDGSGGGDVNDYFCISYESLVSTLLCWMCFANSFVSLGSPGVVSLSSISRPIVRAHRGFWSEINPRNERVVYVFYTYRTGSLQKKKKERWFLSYQSYASCCTAAVKETVAVWGCLCQWGWKGPVGKREESW